jgi:molybdopterin synthase sulfur carrier subunit
MRINLRYFASLREALGSGQSIDLPEGATVGAARDRLRALSPAHASALDPARAVRAALNQTLCEPSATLAEGDELAFFPPVTGG